MFQPLLRHRTTQDAEASGAFRRPERGGFTLVELMIAMVILTVCCGMLTSTITGTMHHNRIKQERQIAVEAARAVVEDLHNIDFHDVFWTFNDDPADDGEVAGSAPGSHFAVEGLRPLDDDLDGFVGQIILPSEEVPLLESSTNEALGLPRDLNGDLVIDDEDHSQDYLILPVQVRLQWQSSGGECQFELNTMLANIRKVD